MSRPGLSEVINALGTPPRLSLVVSQLLVLFRDPQSSTADIKRVVAHDPELSSHIVSLATVAAERRGKAVRDLNTAVNFLGFESLKSLVLVVGVKEAIPKKEGSSRFEISRFWRHTYAAGIAYRYLARQEGLDHELLFLCGMMHDIGKILINVACPKEMEQLMVMAERSQSELHGVEGMVFATSHAEVGSWLCERWGLPSEIAYFVKSHHRFDPEMGEAIFQIAVVADYLLREWGLSSPGAFGEPEVKEKIWSQMIFKKAQIRQARRDLIEELSLLDELFPSTSDPGV